MLKVGFLFLVLVTAETMAAKVSCRARYRDGQGRETMRHQRGGIADGVITTVIQNMGNWSNGRFEANRFHGGVAVTNVDVAPNFAAADGMSHDMYMAIANNVAPQPPHFVDKAVA